MNTVLNAPPRLDIGDDGVAVIALQRPEVLNRLDGDDLDTLQRHLEQVARDPSVRVLVLTGSGRIFCAGYHLGDLATYGGATDGPKRFERACDALAALPQPTVARLNGSVYGGATDLALACDFRIGVHGMELRMPAARLGLHYYAGGLQRAVARLGLATAKRLFLLAEAQDHLSLLRMGYLDECVPPTELDGTVQRWVDALRAGAPLAVRGMKASLDELAVGRGDARVIRAREADCAASQDLQEGLAAFAERRSPQFRGR